MVLGASEALLRKTAEQRGPEALGTSGLTCFDLGSRSL